MEDVSECCLLHQIAASAQRFAASGSECLLITGSMSLCLCIYRTSFIPVSSKDHHACSVPVSCLSCKGDGILELQPIK